MFWCMCSKMSAVAACYLRTASLCAVMHLRKNITSRLWRTFFLFSWRRQNLNKFKVLHTHTHTHTHTLSSSQGKSVSESLSLCYFTGLAKLLPTQMCNLTISCLIKWAYIRTDHSLHLHYFFVHLILPCSYFKILSNISILIVSLLIHSAEL